MPRPRVSTIRTCVSLRSSQLDMLRRLSQETGAPLAELMRRALDAYLAGKLAGLAPGWLHPGPAPREDAPPAEMPRH